MSEESRPSILPVVIGIALTCVMLAALGYAASRRNAVNRAGAPQLTIVAPAEGAAADSPLVIRFTSARPIELRESGWGHANFHLHAVVEHVEHMPAADDIVAVDSLEYQWTIAAAARGAAHFVLGWADQAHRPVLGGASDTMRVIIR
jgi:hypothetical protein